MISTDKLREFGADVDAGLARCMGNEALYLRLVASIPSETNFDKLSKGIEEHDLDMAFDAAHALKGVTGNLSLTPLYEPIVRITELLRNRTDTDYTELLTEISDKKDKLKDLL